ncbi:hypothetical protein [Anaerococcus porci]|uniref:hypothetical protein n=1 Tax=Anaerococcus porci TaxID=2652269 RepID=UPI002A765676|nr:hypothetical protein [Anaerococcus porci]MDY3007259.1 hypothetical protein [Anaerococcus porci]
MERTSNNFKKTSIGRKQIVQSGVFSLALMMFSSHAGGGFATGNQANTYFVGFGNMGIISAIFAMFILSFVVREAIIMYRANDLKSYKDLFKCLYHPFDKLSIFFEIFYQIMVLMAIASAISGAASALKEYMNFNYVVAAIMVSAIVLFLVIFGADFVRKISAVMGIVILVTAISIYIIGSFMGEGIFTIMKADFIENGFSNFPKAGINSFVYAGFQCVQIPSLIACSNVINNKNEASLSMNIAFIINFIALVLSVTMLLSWRSVYMNVDGGEVLPTLTSTQAMGFKWMGIFYSISLFMCLLSTAVSIAYGFVANFENTKVISIIKSVKIRRAIVALFIISISMFISMVGLTNIIKYGYGYCGYIAIIFIIIPFMTVGVYKNRKIFERKIETKMNT